MSDILLVNEEIKQLRELLKKRNEKRIELEKKIEKLKKEIDVFDEKTSDIINTELSKLQKKFTFLNEVEQKINQLTISYNKAKETQREIKDLVFKAFNRLTNKRVVVPKDIIDIHEYYYDNHLTLYSKGFGSAYYSDSPSRRITEWKILRRIFETPEIASYIEKPDKKEIFNVFSEYINNWIDFKDDELTKIAIKNKNIPYLKVKEDYYSNTVSLEKTTATSIAIRTDYYDVVTIEIDYVRKNVKNLGFGELYALYSVWKELEEKIDSKIRLYNSISENNRLVLDKIKKKISYYLVTDAL